MRVHAYLLCYNESSIMDFILDYYSSFCEKIFILDNCSTDKSVDIALKYINVEVLRWGSGGVLDDDNYIYLKTELYKKYSRGLADFVITADMDEVIYHPNLISKLKEFKDEGVTVPKVIGYNMASKDDLVKGVNIVRQVKSGVRYDVFDKRIVFNPNMDISFSVGCHPHGPGHKALLENPEYLTSEDPVYLLHYKHIGTRHYDTAKSSALRLSEKNKEKGWGSHYQGNDVELIEKSLSIYKRSKLVIGENGEICCD